MLKDPKRSPLLHFLCPVDRLSKMSFLPFPKYVFSNTFIYVYLRSLKNRKPEDPLLSTFLVFASGNLNLPILSRFLSVCCRKVRVGLCIRIFWGKNTCFCSFGTPVFLLMLRINLIHIEFFVLAYHFKLLACVDSVNETWKKVPRKPLGSVFDIGGVQDLLIPNCEKMFSKP